MPIEFTPSRTLLAAIQQFQTKVRADRGQPVQGVNAITTETIDAVLGNSQYQVKGKTLSTSGVSPNYTAGEQVYVGWRDGAMIAILGHTARRAKFVPVLAPAGVNGIVEELFCAPNTNPALLEVWFRNYDLCVPLDIRKFLPGDPTGIKWGADRKSFVLQTGAGATRLWWVFRFTSKPGDKILAPGAKQGAVEFVRGEDPYNNPMVITTISADLREIRDSISAKWLNFTFQSEVAAILPSQEHPATGLGYHTKEGSSSTRITNTESLRSTQDTHLQVSVALNQALAGSIAGVTLTISDYFLDKSLNFVLCTTVAFSSLLRGDGTLTRSGLLPKAFLAVATVFGPPDDISQLISEDAEAPGPDITYVPTSLPTVGAVTNRLMSSLLGERHVFVLNTTTGAVLFTTTRATPNLFDDSYLALPAMAEFSSDPFSSPVGADANRFMGHRQRVQVFSYANILSGTTAFTVDDNTGTIPYQFDPEGTAYAVVLADLLAFQAGGGAPPPGGTMSWKNDFYDINGLWPGGDGIGVSGLKKARADLWDHRAPWIDGDGDALNLGPLPIDHAQDFDFGLVNNASNFVEGFNALSNPPSIFGMTGVSRYYVIKYSTTAYETRAQIPTAYRVTSARLLQFGQQGTIWLALERVTNSGPAGTPVWTKAVAVYVIRLDGRTVVSNPLPWTSVGVSNTPIANYIADDFDAFYYDGTRIDLLAEGPGHVFWAISTTLERVPTPPVRRIKLSQVSSGFTLDFGTNLDEYNAERYRNLGIDFLYKATEDTKTKGRKFILAWDFKTGLPLLVQGSADYPQVEGAMTPASPLLNLPTTINPALITVSHYHGINDKAVLQQLNRFRKDTADPYPTT